MLYEIGSLYYEPKFRFLYLYLKPTAGYSRFILSHLIHLFRMSIEVSKKFLWLFLFATSATTTIEMKISKYFIQIFLFWSHLVKINSIMVSFLGNECLSLLNLIEYSWIFSIVNHFIQDILRQSRKRKNLCVVCKGRHMPLIQWNVVKASPLPGLWNNKLIWLLY